MANTTSTTSFRADISQLKSAMQQAARQVKIANSEFKAATAGMDDWTKSATGLKAKLAQLNTTLTAEKKQLSLLEKEYELTTKEYGENSAAADRVRIALNNQKAAIAKTEKQIDQYNDELKEAEKPAEDFTDSVEEMTDASKSASDGFSVMKAALADLVSDGIKKAINGFKELYKQTISVGATFESSMSKVGAISGANAEQLDQLTAKAKEMGETTIFSATESAEAFQYMAMAGWSVDDMLNGIEGIMNLAAASGEDLATTSDIVTDALTAMGYSAGDASHLADVMAAASANANTNVSLMGATFQYAASIVGSLGMNMEDTAVAIGLMANAGIKGQKAGTALRSILTRLSTDAGASSKTLGALGTLTEELGVQFYELDGSVRPLSSVLKETRKAWKGLTAEQQASYGKTIAGQEALSAWLSLMNAADADVEKLTEAVANASWNITDISETLENSGVSWEKYADKAWMTAGKGIEGLTEDIIYNIKQVGTSTEDLKKYLEQEYDIKSEDAVKAIKTVKAALDDSTGAAKQMADTMNDNVAGQMTLLKSKIEGIQIQVYEKLKPALREAIDSFSKMLDSINWDSVADGLGKATKAVVRFVKTVINNFENIIEVAKSIGKVLVVTFAVNKIATFVSTVAGLISTFKALKTATETATVAQKALNVAQAANVIGAITAAVAGLVSAFLLFSDTSDEVVQHLDPLTASEHRQVDEINAMSEALSEVKARRDEAVESIQAEYNNYQNLAKELDDLVDANGKVKEGYEDRVNFILTTLNDALGTEMKLVDGVIENYNKERQAIDDLIQQKKAEAFLDANKEAYTEAIKNRGQALENYIEAQNDFIQKQKELNELLEKEDELNSLSVEEYAKMIGSTDNLSYAEKQLWVEKQKLIKEIEATKIGMGELHLATDRAEKTFVDYNSTIKNYEGLSSAIISGDTEKISKALQNMANDFITAETGTEQSLKNQVETFEKQYEEMKKAVENGSAVVTKEMVNDMRDMVNKSVEELNKFQDDAEKSAKSGMDKYIDGIESMTGEATLQAQIVRYETAKAMGADTTEFEKAGKDAGQKYLDGMLDIKPDILLGAEGIGSGAVDSLNKGQDSHSPSAATEISGENFGQGFINGMANKTNSIWDMAYSLARQAVNALRRGQKEGSPSKLTYQSGVYFVQGYINGIASQQQSLQKAIQSMVEGVFKKLQKTEAFNFQTVGNAAVQSFSDNLSSRLDYSYSKMSYQNEQKIKKFDAEIERLNKAEETEISLIERRSERNIKNIEAKRDQEVKRLESRIERETKEGVKKQLEERIAEIEKTAADKIKAENKAANAEIEATKKNYAKLTKEQEDQQEAYRTASQQFLAQYQSAVNSYKNAAVDLIDNTINGLADKYNEQYDKLLNKQDALVDKLKRAGSLFNVSGAGIMTVNDLREQTKRITDYTSNLQKIKTKVSAELFDEIASFDMKEGSAYVDRLLSMSAKDLQAYNKAYTEKIQAAEKAGDTIYKADIQQVSKNYKDEINKAFEDLPKQLEDLGTDTMKGFVKGLTSSTDYMEKSVKTFISAMIDTFKKDLKIASPSKVMESIGDYTGAGFVEGLKDTIGKVKQTAGEMVQAAASPLGDVKASVSGVRGIVPAGSGAAVMNNNTVNNYNLVQNNTSPKSLSALETYQARRQQIALVKAFTA